MDTINTMTEVISASIEDDKVGQDYDYFDDDNNNMYESQKN
jgi:hypothetical protein